MQEIDSNLEIASICLTYLSFDNLDVVYSAERTHKVEHQVIFGDLVLFEYASQEWLGHVQTLCSKAGRSDVTSVLGSHLETFFLKRQKDPPVVPSSPLPKEDFRAFRRYPKLRTQLSHAGWFKTLLTSCALEQEGTLITTFPG